MTLGLSVATLSDQAHVILHDTIESNSSRVGNSWVDAPLSTVTDNFLKSSSGY